MRKTSSTLKEKKEKEIRDTCTPRLGCHFLSDSKELKNNADQYVAELSASKYFHRHC